MPASVAAANPTVVMPYSLAIAYQHARAWAVDENVYRNGEVQRTVLVATSRKTWSLTKALTTAELAALYAFWAARGGSQQEFWFYDFWQTVPKLSSAGYDMTGAATAGRYVVRFEGTWAPTLQMGRHQVGVSLIELS